MDCNTNISREYMILLSWTAIGAGGYCRRTLCPPNWLGQFLRVPRDFEIFHGGLFEQVLYWIGLDLFHDDTRTSGHISRRTLVNVSQSCFHSLNNYSSLTILSRSGGYLKITNYIISERRIPLLAGIPLCKSQELSQREHSMSRLCSIHHDIPVTMHTPGAYGQWSVFDHNGDNQSVVLGTTYGIWWPWYGQFEVGWLEPL